jgi:putative DNA primase/helicase
MSIQPTLPKGYRPSSPGALLRRRRWICWRYDQRGRKRPIDPRTGKAAKTNDPQTWATYEAAAAAAEEHGYDGIGFVLTAEDPYAVIDLDGVVDPETGEIESWAAELVDRFDSYAELSPSGKGLHIWVRGSIEGINKAGSPPIEIMCAATYLTFTGRVFHDSVIAERADELGDVHATITHTSQSDTGCTGI